MKDTIAAAVARCAAEDAGAGADLAAWVLGDVMLRISAAERAGDERRDQALAFRTLRDALVPEEEGWFMPHLARGFERVRETGGVDLFGRWSSQIL